MLPFHDPQNFMERSIFQVELNPPPPKPEHSNFFAPLSPSNVNSDDLHDVLSTHLILPSAAASMASALQPLPSILPCSVYSMASTTPPMSSSRRAVRKERHSKILTAMGPRDRRMRLSLEVARKFFNLQDKLGFDRASKTVQWLLTASKASIEKLRAAASRPGDRALSNNESHRINESSTSDCEDVSTVSDRKGKSSQVVVASGEAKRPRAKRAKHPRKAAFHPDIARENRARARARARERTREKKWMSSAMSKDGGNQLWASSSLPLVPIEEESSRHDLKYSSLDLVAGVEERCSSNMPNQHDHHFNERAPEVPLEGGSLPISILDCGHSIMSFNDTISIFQEQWEMERNLQLADHAQLPPTPWEAFNNSPIA